jgi:hypothetical protein
MELREAATGPELQRHLVSQRLRDIFRPLGMAFELMDQLQVERRQGGEERHHWQPETMRRMMAEGSGGSKHVLPFENQDSAGHSILH